MSKKNRKSIDTDENQHASVSRNVFMFDRLETELALPIIKRLLKLNNWDPDAPINFYINSSGGNGYNADAIIATMHSISAPVNTICLGHALSGACEVLAAGTGQRSAFEFSTMMVHQTLWETDGDITNLEIQAAQGQRFRKAQIELLHRCTGQEKEKIRADIDRDFYLSAPDALAYGLIDKIIYHTGSRSRQSRPKPIGTVSNTGYSRVSNIAIAQLPQEAAKSSSRAVLIRESKSVRRSRKVSRKK